MNGFRKLQERLTQEGWYVGWGLPCCQQCAWGAIPDAHKEGEYMDEEIDLEKVLFNHEQDCENDDWMDGLSDDQLDEYEGPMVLFSPEEQNNSVFCFNSSKEGVKNLEAILPIIKECGCVIQWNGKGSQRPTISWEL